MSRWGFSRFLVAFSAFLFCTIVGSWGDFNRALAADASPLISQTRAAQHGMQRQWHTQVGIDPSNNRVTHLSYVPKGETSPDMLFVQTERSIVFAIDAETGKTLWSRLVGRPGLMSEAVDGNDQVVGVLNGSSLTILDRRSGRILWTKGFGSVPASAPVLSKRYAYVPYAGGCVAAYPLWKTKTTFTSKTSDWASKSGSTEATTPPKTSISSGLILSQAEVDPLLCPSLHRIETRPILIEDDKGTDRLAWVNRCGIYVGSISSSSGGFNIDYSLTSSLDFEASPTFVPSRFMQSNDAKVPADDKPAKESPIYGALLVASKDGRINAIQAGSGGTLWEYHYGEPIVQPIIAIESRAYVVSQFGSMVCFDVQSGKKLWTKKNVSQFVAQTKERVYALDQAGERLLILRATDGSQIDQLGVPGFTKAVSNDKTDRLFLATESGLIQSLRQRGVKEPIRYR